MTGAQLLHVTFLGVLLRRQRRLAGSSSTVTIKKELLDKGLSLAGIARELKTKKQGSDAIRVMLSQMVHGKRFYPALAERVEQKYGLRLTRPAANGSMRKKAA